MTTRTGNAALRSSLLFIIGLLAAAGLAIGFDSGGRYLALSGSAALDLTRAPLLEPRPPRPLSAEDRRAATIAWAYIRANTQEETGLVDSVAGYPSTTIWDQGSYLLALVAARELQIIPETEFDTRTTRLLTTLKALPLYEDRLPNKVYDTRTLNMADYDNTVSRHGIGWSALDIARMLAALRVLERHRPDHGNRIRALLATWDLNAMTGGGDLIGATREPQGTVYHQEGRIGYEQYGARAAALWGLDVARAISAREALDWVSVEGVETPVDLRRSEMFRAITPTLSEPYMLQGLELGLDAEGRALAARVYAAQEARYEATGQQTMVSEDHIDRAPYFLYSSVFSNGQPWAVVTKDGDFFPDLRTVSTKAVFAWDALYDTGYTDRLRAGLSALADPGRGWPAGAYERDGSVNDVYALNTNAVILEAVHYMAHGPLWQMQ